MASRWKLSDDQRVVLVSVAVWAVLLVPLGGLAGSIDRDLHAMLALGAGAVVLVTAATLKERLRRKRLRR